MPGTIDPNAITVTLPADSSSLASSVIRARLAEIKAQFVAALADIDTLELAIAAIPSGTDGSTVLSGSVAPTTEGVDGDFYIDIVTSTIYGPKAAGVWPAGVSLVGPTGAQGIQGEQGIQGIQGIQGEQGIQGDPVPVGYVYAQTLYYYADANFVKANYPWLRAIRAHLVGRGGNGGWADPTGAGQVSLGGGGGGGGYVMKFITDIAGLPASAPIVVSLQPGSFYSTFQHTADAVNVLRAFGGDDGSDGAPFSPPGIGGPAGQPANTGLFGDIFAPGGSGDRGIGLTTSARIPGRGGASGFLGSKADTSVGWYGQGGTGGNNGASAGGSFEGQDGNDGIVFLELFA